MDRRAGAAITPRFIPPTNTPFGIGGVANFASPELVDIDNDGDLDAFLGEHHGDVLFFRNSGTAASPSFAAPSTSPFGLSDVGNSSSPDLVDIDGDGDLDAFIGAKDGITNFFRNTGTAASPAFAPRSTAAFGLSDVGTFSNPALADIDGDGDLDAFIGEYNGTTIFFRNTGTPTLPAFALPSTGPFALADVGDYAAPELADIDGDGDLDAFLGSESGATTFFRNTGTVASPAFAAASAGAFGLADVGADSTPHLIDIDGDTDLDALVGERLGTTVLFHNTGSRFSATFAAPSTTHFGLTDVNVASAPDLADIDGDGDLDAFVGERYGTTRFFRNTGTAAFPAFSSPSTNPFGLADVGRYSTPDLVDIDGDGDLDVFVGEEFGATIFFRNTGTAASPAFAPASTTPFGLADVGSYSSPNLVDIDGDGDLDAFIGERNGSTFFFRNTGTVVAPAFGPASVDPFGLSRVSSASSPAFADIDGDRDLDAFIGDRTGHTNFFRNTGTVSSPSFSVRSRNPFGLTQLGGQVAPELADIDSDGDPDALLGESYGRLFFFKNDPLANSPPVDLTLSANTVAENAPVSTGVGTLFTTDADADDSHTYALVTGAGDEDNGSFAINGSTLQTAASFDFETDAPKSVRIRTVDSNAAAYEEAFIVTITDVNETPSDIALSGDSVVENASSGTMIGTLSTTDEDANDTHSYSLVPGGGADDNASFSIVGSTLETAASLDFESGPTRSVRVEADDGNGGTRQEVFTITITDANDAPTDVELSNNTVEENRPPGSDVGTLTTEDQDAGAAHTYTLVAGAGDDENASFSIVDSTLETVGPLDFETLPTMSIRIRTDDGVGGTFEKELVVSVTDANDVPTELRLSASRVNENEPSGTAVGMLSTEDQDAAAEHSYALVAGAGDDDNADFMINGSTLETAGPFDFESDPTRSVRVKTDDGDGGTLEEIFAITVTDVAEGFSISDVTLAEGDSRKTAFTFTVTRTGDTSAPATVKVKTANGTAKADKDFRAIPKKKRMIKFAAGETSKIVTVKVIGETKLEADETFTVVLSKANGAVIVDATGVGTITNDD